MFEFNKNLTVLLTCSVLAAATAAACSGDDTKEDGGAGMGGNTTGGSSSTSGGASAGGTNSGGNSSGGSGGSGTGTGGAFEGVAGEGLAITVAGVTVSDKGEAVVDFTLQDAAGRPVDLYGEKTFGAVSANFILSWLGENDEGESTQYTAYTLATAVTEDGKTEEIQSSYDQGGTYETLEVGHYKYTLATKVDINKARKGLTHTLGVYATRTVSDVRYVASDLKSWVPDGSEVTSVLDVVNDTACNACHTRLEAHGGARRGVEECQLCHTESNSIDPETGNTIDFQVMIHKIHMGAELPSVQGGEPYTIVGYRNSVHDYSEVEYPWSMSDCSKCHQGSQGDRWITRPAEKPCASCHDRTYYGDGDAPEGWVKHTAGPRDDSECIVCHGEDSLEPISKSHVTSLTDTARPVVTAEILSVKNTKPGQSPNVEFKIEIDATPVDILANHPDRLRLRFFGPTTDVVLSLGEVIHYEKDGVVATECGDPVVPPCLEPAASGESFIFHSTVVVPPEAKGTYLVGLDGRYAFEAYGNIAFKNPIRPVLVTGDAIVNRREIVGLDQCNSCHGDLGAHGGNYREPLYCLNCHNTTQTAPVEGLMPGDSAVSASLNLKDWIHSIHSSVAYPAPLNDCQQCHLEGTYEVPLASGLAASTYAEVSCSDTNASCDGMGGATSTPAAEEFDVPPESAACVSCHNSAATLAHAETNTGRSGEACATCHGAGKNEAVGVVHALAP